MFDFTPIKTNTSPLFSSFWKLYQTAFPKHEQRSLKGQIACFKQVEFHLLAVSKASCFIGFISYWQVNGMLYIEHLAIEPQERNNQFGSAILTAFLLQNSTTYVLEIDPPITPIAERRHNFYLRLKFCDNPHEHQQPPYQIDDEAAPMLLMSYPRPITHEEHQMLLAFLFSDKTCRI